MNMIALMMILFSFFMLITSVNPVKMCLSLILSSLSLFIFMFGKNSSIWMSAIFFMIFIGGIMIMFMILTSLLPNEKNLKLSKKLIPILILSLIMISLGSSICQTEGMPTQQMKVIFFSNESFETLMLAILLYFLIFIYILSKENSSLRSFLCY